MEEIQTDNRIAYYDAVSYDVVGQVEDRLGGRGTTLLEDSICIRVKVKVGDVIEFRASFEADGRGFAKIAAVMRHRNTVFLVVSWLMSTDEHRLLGLPQYRQVPIFGECRSAFFSLCLVDHPRFVGGTHFVDVGKGILVRNDWVFNVV